MFFFFFSFSFIAVSVVVKGKQMVEVLNLLNIKCAVFGNHEFGMLQPGVGGGGGGGGI